MNNELHKGSVVKYKTGWMRVRAVFKDRVNLGHVFGGKTVEKNVPISEVTPDHENWLAAWEKTESYQSM
jgi:hypothetical protein